MGKAVGLSLYHDLDRFAFSSFQDVDSGSLRMNSLPPIVVMRDRLRTKVCHRIVGKAHPIGDNLVESPCVQALREVVEDCQVIQRQVDIQARLQHFTCTQGSNLIFIECGTPEKQFSNLSRRGRQTLSHFKGGWNETLILDFPYEFIVNKK